MTVYRTTNEQNKFTNDKKKVYIRGDNLNHAEAQLHKGNAYTLNGFETLADGDIKDFTFQTAANSNANLTFTVKATLHTNIIFQESGSFLTGSAITPINRNRQSSNVSTVITTNSASFIDLSSGINLISASFGTDTIGQGSQGSGGDTRAEQEFILANDKEYYLRITSLTAANIVDWDINWYEDSDI